MALLGKFLWEIALRVRGAEVDLQGRPPQTTGAALQCAPSRTKHGRKPLWISRDLLIELKHKKKAHKLRGTIQKGHRDSRQACRDRAGKGKA